MVRAVKHQKTVIPAQRNSDEPVVPREPEPRFAPSWSRAWLPSVVPAALMLVVAGVGVRSPSLGWDENATWLISDRTAGQIIGTAGRADGVIAPYYLFMHFWTALFGDSELALRAPSLIAVTLGVGLAGELGRRVFSPGVGLLGALFLVVVPQLSRYAQDARVYGLAFLLATASTLLFHLALKRPGWGRWIAYAAAVTLLGVAHILGLLVLAGHAYAVLTRWWASRDRALLRWVAVTAVAVLPVLPLVLLGLTQRGDQLDWIEPMGVDQVIAAPGAIFGAPAVGLLLIGLALAVRWADRRPVVEFAVLAVVPPVLVLGVSFLTSSIWVPRYVMFVLPMVTLLAAAALRGLRLRAVIALALAAVVGLPAQQTVRGTGSHHGPNFRRAAALIAAGQQPGDGIVYGTGGTWSLRAGIDYQLRDRERPRDLLMTRPAAEVGGLDAEQCADRVACLDGTRRVWFVRLWASGTPLTDAGPLRATLERDYRQAGLWQISKGTVALYEHR